MGLNELYVGVPEMFTFGLLMQKLITNCVDLWNCTSYNPSQPINNNWPAQLISWVPINCVPDVIIHDDVIKWQHFLRYWPFVWGIRRAPVNSPHKGQWRGVFFYLRLNKRLSKQSWGWWFETLSRPLWCHCNVFGPLTCRSVYIPSFCFSFFYFIIENREKVTKYYFPFY